MSSRTRRRFTTQQKAQIVRRHLGDKVVVSDLADEFNLQPSQIHTWVKEVLDQAEKAFKPATSERRSDQAKDAKITRIEQKLVTKNEVIAELMEVNVLLKKATGEL